MDDLGAHRTLVAPGRVHVTLPSRLEVTQHIEAIGTVLKAGRTLSVCQLEVFAVDGETRKLVAAGQQTLIGVPRQPTA